MKYIFRPKVCQYAGFYIQNFPILAAAFATIDSGILYRLVIRIVILGRRDHRSPLAGHHATYTRMGENRPTRIDRTELR